MPLSLADVLDQFRRALRAAGLDFDGDLIADGKLHRYRVEGDKAGSKNGHYVLHSDGVPAGEFGSWKTGQKEAWRADIGRTLTAEEDAAHRQRLAIIKEQRREDERREHERAAAKAVEMWGKASEAVKASHPYLVTKGVRAYGLRQMREQLLVPLRKNDALTGLQFIGADGGKKFLTGTVKAGAYHLIGEASEHSALVVIAEGYATAASVHALGEHAVAVAFDAGNLLLVARALRRRCPAACIVIAADDDRETPGNPGLTKARAAAEVVGGVVCAPPFEPGDAGSDWNDYAKAQGQEAAREALRTALDAAATQHGAQAMSATSDAPTGEPGAVAGQASGEALRPRYELCPDGLYWCDVEFDGKGKAREHAPLFLCSPLAIEAVTRDTRGHGWGRLLRFTDSDAVSKSAVIPARLFGTSRSDELRGALLDAGLPIIAGGAKAQRQLNDYLMREVPSARARFVTRMGWHGSSFVLPAQTFGPANGERFHLADEVASTSAYERAGRFDLWRDAVAMPCGAHKRALFAMACAFAGPLVELAGAESGGFHLVGGSSSGKTTALRLAASVWGSPASFWRQWRTTDNGLEAIAEEFNDTLLALDEIGQADPRIVGEVSYMLANGRGKARAKKEGGARSIKSWRLMLLSTGEVGTSNLMNASGQKSRAGHEVRLVELPADAGRGCGLFDSTGNKGSARELAMTLIESAGEHYGHAGPLFVEKLAGRRIEIAREARECIAQFVTDVCPRGADGQVLRVAARFGLVCYAGELATEWKLTGWDFEAVRSACADAFQAWLKRRGTAGAKEPAAMVAQVRAFIEEHGGATFQDITDYKRAQGRGEAARYAAVGEGDAAQGIAEASDHERKIIHRAGFRWQEPGGRTLYAVLPEAFKSKLCSGFEPVEVCKALAAAKVVVKPDSSGDRYTAKHRVPNSGKPIPFYVLDGDVLMDGDVG
ncbi:MAG: DUF927 domain-containing protein [Pseudomonadota bacterium]